MVNIRTAARLDKLAKERGLRVITMKDRGRRWYSIGFVSDGRWCPVLGSDSVDIIESYLQLYRIKPRCDLEAAPAQ